VKVPAGGCAQDPPVAVSPPIASTCEGDQELYLVSVAEGRREASRCSIKCTALGICAGTGRGDKRRGEGRLGVVLGVWCRSRGDGSGSRSLRATC
jgi:hypothetical protein